MILAVFGLVVGLLAFLIAWEDPEERRFDIYLFLFGLHIFITIMYILYTIERANDTLIYYIDPYYYRNAPFATGTVAVTKFVQTLKSYFGGSYQVYFFLFQSFGMVGMALLIRSISELGRSLSVQVPYWYYFILFAPSMHFWSVAIGKDSLLFLAVTLTAWVSLKLERRVFWLVPAFAIMVLVRPHMAAIVLVCGLFALLLHRNVGIAIKLLMAPVGIAALTAVFATVSEQFRINPLDAESLSNFFERSQELGERFGKGADLQDLSYPLQVFALLFRPLFIDATGILGIIASIENVLLLVLFGYLGLNWRVVYHLAKHSYFVAFGLLYSTATVLLLAAVNYNIGLGQRQKMMAIPPIILIFVFVLLYKKYVVTQSGQQTARLRPA